MNSIAVSANTAGLGSVPAAAAPASTGTDPGMAPTSVQCIVRFFSGVYANTYETWHSARNTTASGGSVAQASTAPPMLSVQPNIAAEPGETTPDGNGRFAV